MCDLAVVLEENGDEGGAETLYRQALAAQREVSGESDLDTLNTRSMLADLLRGQGELSQAELMYRENLAAAKTAFGTTAAMSGLANTLADKVDGIPTNLIWVDVDTAVHSNFDDRWYAISLLSTARGCYYTYSYNSITC